MTSPQKIARLLKEAADLASEVKSHREASEGRVNTSLATMYKTAQEIEKMGVQTKLDKLQKETSVEADKLFLSHLAELEKSNSNIV